MYGLLGYGTECSENSPNSPRKRKMNQPQKAKSNTTTTDASKDEGKSSEQLEAEWASFQAMISAEKMPERAGSEVPAGDAPRVGGQSSDGADSKDDEDRKAKNKRRDSSSSSESGSDKSGKSRDDTGSSDDSSDDDSADEKFEKSNTNIEKDKSRSKSPNSAPAKKKQRSFSSSSESETEKKPAPKPTPSQSAGKPNGQSRAEPSDKDRRPSRSSPSPKRRHSRSRSHERRRKIRPRSRSHDRKRRRRPKRSRSRGRRSRSRERKPRRRSRSHERDDKMDNKKPGDRPKLQSQVVPAREKRRSRSRSPKRRRGPRSRSRSHNRRRRRSHSRSPPRGFRRRRRRRRRRKRRPSGRLSRSRSRSPSPVVKKKRNEPLNYKEKLKQSLLQVQKQAAEGKLNLDDLAIKSKDLLPNDKPNILPLMGKDNPLVVMTAGQLGVTPQQALLQTMAAMHQKNVAAMHQKAQELTGVAVPKYYNPSSVNPLKYAEQFQKRKLLWGKKIGAKPAGEETPAPDQKGEAETKSTTTATKPKTQWEGALFSQDQDGKQAAKFRKLMGMKHGESADGAVGSEAAEELDDTQLKKHEEMFSRLDQEYEFARMATHTHRGIGLGFTTMHHQYTNNK